MSMEISRGDLKWMITGAVAAVLGGGLVLGSSASIRQSKEIAERTANRTYPSLSQRAHQEIRNLIELYTWAELTPEQETLFRSYKLIDADATKNTTLRRDYAEELIQKDWDTPVRDGLAKGHLQGILFGGGMGSMLGGGGALWYLVTRRNPRSISPSPFPA